MSLDSRLQALADDHARQVDAIAERADEGVRALYRRVAGMSGDGRWPVLRAGLLQSVQGARKAAHGLATGHVLEEMRVLVGRGVERLSLPMGEEPKRADVTGYVDNAVALAQGTEDMESTAYRGETIVESEALETYTQSRAASEDALRRMSDTQAERAGFRVARVAAALRTMPGVETRLDEGSIPLIAKRWSALNDRRTCAVCHDLDGDRALLGGQFDGRDTPVHARCRCITHLISVGYVKVDKAMATDMQDTGVMLRMDVEVRASPGEDRTIRGVVASDETLDGHGSIIRAAGWDLTRYNANPVLLWAHSSGSALRPPKPEDVLGTADVRVVDGRLMADLRFMSPGKNPQADLVLEQMREKVIRGVSVGFRPLAYHYENEGADNEVVVVDKAELVELSVVPVPSNPNALARELRALGDTPACKCSDRRMLMDREDKPVVLPPEIAALLSVDSVEAARGAIAALQLRADELTKRVEAETARADSAEQQLTERVDADVRSVVDGLVKTGRISEPLRDAALTLARADVAAFRAMYPDQPANDMPQRAALESRIVAPEKPATKKAAKVEDFSARVNELVRKHLGNGSNYVEAHERALADLEKENVK